MQFYYNFYHLFSYLLYLNLHMLKIIARNRGNFIATQNLMTVGGGGGGFYEESYYYFVTIIEDCGLNSKF